MELGVFQEKKIRNIYLNTSRDKDLPKFNHSQEKSPLNSKELIPLKGKKLNEKKSSRQNSNNYRSNEKQTNEINNEIMFSIKVEVKEGLFEVINFKISDTVENVAYSISLKHNLDSEKFDLLKSILLENFERHFQLNSNELSKSKEELKKQKLTTNL